MKKITMFHIEECRYCDFAKKAISELREENADYFKDWNYRKHAKFCTAIYLGLYAFDMTVSYFIIRKLFGKTASR
jgi:hypothetical protein